MRNIIYNKCCLFSIFIKFYNFFLIFKQTIYVVHFYSLPPVHNLLSTEKNGQETQQIIPTHTYSGNPPIIYPFTH